VPKTLEGLPLLSELARVTAPVFRSLTYSWPLLGASETRLVAVLPNRTRLPSLLIDSTPEVLLASWPLALVSTTMVVPVSMSRRKTWL